MIRPVDGELDSNPTAAFTDYGIVEHSGAYSGLPSEEARRRMNQHAEREGFGKAAITYRIKDWGISRQRYWGTPIPVIHCPKCGLVPVPEKDLPVILPLDVKITGKGRSPLEDVDSFMNVTCPNCGEPARRESDTMDTFVDSSWYFYRYCDPHNDQAPVRFGEGREVVPDRSIHRRREHAILHLIYSRFFTKVMRDLGLIKNDEPAATPVHPGHGDRADGAAMSKSKGNAVSAGRDGREVTAPIPCRLFVLFAAPPEKDMDWIEASVGGQRTVPGARVALRHAQPRSRGGFRRSGRGSARAAQAAPDDSKSHRRFQ